jgi:hypothetical protein
MTISMTLNMEIPDPNNFGYEPLLPVLLIYPAESNNDSVIDFEWAITVILSLFFSMMICSLSPTITIKTL